MGEEIVTNDSGIRQHFHTSSLKPLDQLNSYGIWKLQIRMREEKCSKLNGPGHMTKVAATSIYGKNPLKSPPG